MCKKRIYLVSFALLIMSSAASAAEPNETKNYVGISNWFLNDWDGSNALVDIMMQAREWQNYGWTATATIDANGWPTQDCSTVIFYPGNELGTYKLVFTGQASSISMMWWSGSVSNVVYNAGTNTTTADVTLTVVNAGSGGLKFLNTQRTSASAVNTGITNVHLYRPGYATDGSAVLTTRYRGVIGKFQVIRFMDWMSTNSNPIETWAQRRNPNQANIGNVSINGHTGDKGMPMEIFIQICNDINADLWINIPINADDDYVTKTAQLILYGSDGVNPYTSTQASPVYLPLNSNLKVYVEYGNEIWNTAGGFYCYTWVKAKSDAIMGSPYTHAIEYDGESDQYTLCARYAAWRTVENGKLFRSVFGDAAMMTRVRPLLMGQLGYNWFNERGLIFLDGYYSTYRPGTDPFPNTDPKPVSYYIYGAGGSAYYGVNSWTSATPDTFFATSNYPETTWWKSTGVDALRAKNYGLKRIAYEAGMGLDGGGNTFTGAQKQTLNADTRMKTLTETYQDVWSQTGGDLIVYYCARGPVNWEFTWDIDNTSTPKLQAIDNIRDNLTRATVTLGQTVPGTVVVRDQRDNNVYIQYAPSYTYDTTISGENCIVFKSSGEWACCALNTTQEGNYNISVRLATSAAINLIISMNGTRIGTIPVANTGGSLVNSSTLLVPVYKGLNAVRITASGAGMKLRSATFTYVSSFGDFNGDGHENFIDFAIFANAWKSQQGQANWNAACDIASPKDNIIDGKDLATFAGNWLKGF